jgi:hypothetical protein
MYTDESLGYMRNFLESISASYGEMELVSSSEESVLYEHPDGRHVWVTYGNASVKLKGDETTIDRSEDILTSEIPRTSYARSRVTEEGAKVSSALKAFGGLFD